MKLSNELKHILKILQPCMLVGGFVRDSILGVNSQDIDIVTLNTPDKVTILLENENIKVIPTGIEHGTLTAIYNKQKFEITTARKDIKTDGRHAEVVFSDSFAEDAMRRDFTFNALYAQPNGEIIDFIGGVEDLNNGIIRFIGDANKRIDEDYLRILRFFRFYARYSKHKVSDELLTILENKSKLLTKLSAERITCEICKILAVENIMNTLSIMEKTKVLKVLKLYGGIKQVAKLPAKPILRLYSLGGKNIAKNRYFVFSNIQKQYFKNMAKSENTHFTESNLAEKSYFLGKEICVDILRYMAIKTDQQKYNNWADEVIKQKEQIFPLTGKDLIKQGYTEGEELGFALKKAEKWWAENNFPDKKDILQNIL